MFLRKRGTDLREVREFGLFRILEEKRQQIENREDKKFHVLQEYILY